MQKSLHKQRRTHLKIDIEIDRLIEVMTISGVMMQEEGDTFTISCLQKLEREVTVKITQKTAQLIVKMYWAFIGQ